MTPDAVITRMSLYVPAPGSRIAAAIVPASAIVGCGLACHPESVLIDFEGAIHGQRMSFEDKIQHAAGRAAARYPTTARMAVGTSDVVVVGTIRLDGGLRAWVIDTLSDPRALRTWIGEDPPAVGGSPDLHLRAAGLRLSRPVGRP